MTSMKPIIHGLFLFWLLLCAAPLRAQSLEIITLQHRSAEQLVPQLQAFLDRGAALTGMNDRLFIKTSARNLAQLRELIAGMDTPVRRLMISLRSADRADTEGAAAQGQVSVASGKVSSRGTASVYTSERNRASDISQQVQTIDGGRALLRVGQSFVLPMRQVVLGAGGVVVADTWVEREISSGFVAVAQVIGDQVSIDISPQIERMDQVGPMASPGERIERQQLSTTVRGRVGEWLRLGGTVNRDDDERHRGASAGSIGGVHYATRSGNEARQLLLKVDVLP